MGKSFITMINIATRMMKSPLTAIWRCSPWYLSNSSRKEYTIIHIHVTMNKYNKGMTQISIFQIRIRTFPPSWTVFLFVWASCCQTRISLSTLSSNWICRNWLGKKLGVTGKYQFFPLAWANTITFLYIVFLPYTRYREN